MSVQEVNRLELELLRLLDYRLAVPWEEVRAVMRQLLAGSFVVGHGEVRGLGDVVVVVVMEVVSVQRGWGRMTRDCGSNDKPVGQPLAGSFVVGQGGGASAKRRGADDDGSTIQGGGPRPGAVGLHALVREAMRA